MELHPVIHVISVDSPSLRLDAQITVCFKLVSRPIDKLIQMLIVSRVRLSNFALLLSLLDCHCVRCGCSDKNRSIVVVHLLRPLLFLLWFSLLRWYSQAFLNHQFSLAYLNANQLKASWQSVPILDQHKIHLNHQADVAVRHSCRSEWRNLPLA